MRRLAAALLMALALGSCAKSDHRTHIYLQRFFGECGAETGGSTDVAKAEGECGIITTLINRFNAENPDVHVDVNVVAWPGYPQLTAQVAARDPPDLVTMHEGVISDYALKGLLEPVPRDINLQGPETPVTVGFVGSTQTATVNRITQPRPIAGFARIEEFQSSANSIYNGLTVQLNKRLSQNYQFLASYTFGKVIDDNPDATSVVPFSGDDAKMVQDPLNLRGDRGPGVNDQRHRFVLSAIWDLDSYTHSMSRSWRYLTGGWQLSGILTAQSGQPYSGLVNSDLNTDSNSRTDRAPGLGRDTFYLPKFVSLDPRITKNIPIHERVKAQLILEAYNSLNRTNFTSVSATQFSTATGCAGAPTICLGPPRTPFQTPLSTQLNFSPGSRIVQLSGKITF